MSYTSLDLDAAPRYDRAPRTLRVDPVGRGWVASLWQGGRDATATGPARATIDGALDALDAAIAAEMAD